MGTRAQFFVGNPQDLHSREWLGCIAWDGYPDGDCSKLKDAKSAEDFISIIEKIRTRDDFTDPLKQSFPFPWRDNLFRTDYTYAFFDGRVQVTYFHNGWRDLVNVLAAESNDDLWPEEDRDELPNDVLAPKSEKPKGPDSIMIFTTR